MIFDPEAFLARSKGMVILSPRGSSIVRPFSPSRLPRGIEVKPILLSGTSGPSPALRGVRAISVYSAFLRAFPSVALGDVVKGALLHLPELIEEVEDVLFAAEIYVVGLDHEDRRSLVVEKEIVEGLDDVLEVLLGDVLLQSVALLGHPPGEGPERDLEIDDQVGFGDALGQDTVDLLVNKEFVVGKGLIGVDLVLLEEVIADDAVDEQVPLEEADLLVVAVGQIDELRQEGRALLLVIEVLQVGVADVVEDDLAADPLGPAVGQVGLLRPEHDADGHVLDSDFVSAL